MHTFYPLYKRALLLGALDAGLNINTPTDGLYCVLLNIGTYTYNASHEFFTHLTGVLGTPTRIVNQTISLDAVVDGQDVVFTGIAASQNIGAIVTYRRNSGPSTGWRLVTYYDDVGGGLPAVSTGASVTVQWAPPGIYQL